MTTLARSSMATPSASTGIAQCLCGREPISVSKGRITLRLYQPSARRVYQPAALP